MSEWFFTLELALGGGLTIRLWPILLVFGAITLYTILDAFRR